MPEDHLPSMEEMVTAEINGVFESFAPILFAGKREEASNEYSRAMSECWGSVVQRQGLILARMAILPWRKAELKSSMSGIVNRAPAWMNAHYRGERAMTLELYAGNGPDDGYTARRLRTSVGRLSERTRPARSISSTRSRTGGYDSRDRHDHGGSRGTAWKRRGSVLGQAVAKPTAIRCPW